MALNVRFGNGGKASLEKLTDISTAYTLNGPSISTSNAGGGTVGSVIPDGQLSVARVNVPNGGTGTGGQLDVGFDLANNAFSFDVATAWNSVKNASLTADTAQNVSLTDFVHVDIDFSAATGSSNIILNDIKRGNVETGSGNDTVKIALATNGNDWQNKFHVDTGAGNDSIIFKQGSVSDTAKVTDGRFTEVTIDAGDGIDVVDLSGLKLQLATIIGGAGDDNLTGSAGKDVFVYNKIPGGSGLDRISNFQVGIDKLDLKDGITVAASVSSGNNTILTLSDDTMIILKGVTGYASHPGDFLV